MWCWIQTFLLEGFLPLQGSSKIVGVQRSQVQQQCAILQSTRSQGTISGQDRTTFLLSREFFVSHSVAMSDILLSNDFMSIRIWVYVCLHVSVCIYICMRVFACVCMYMCLYVLYVFVCTYARTREKRSFFKKFYKNLKSF